MTTRQPNEPVHNLPRQLTPFVGRTSELAELTERLVDPACRLLTLTGSGGIGKTRLAIQAGGAVLDHFPDGVYFVSLQPLENPELVASTIVDALKLPPPGQLDPSTQLANYLRGKDLLLILDNFEQLVEQVSLLTDLLAAAAGLKILVTSREALNSREEWLYPVDGLPYPPAKPVTELETYSAVQFFVRCARRVRPDFSLDAESMGVAQICRLVEGTPLAIELAASWAKTLTCADIAAEIGHNLEFLATRLRDVPTRHRSMQAVFNRSWQRLSPQEQTVFKRLAVFRGAFRRQAAEVVAEASLVTLTALVDKSLLRWLPEGHYQIHELLRQYAAEQLARSAEEEAQVYAQHCAYYVDYLSRRRTDLLGNRQQAAGLEIEAELENIRAAWQWAVARARVGEIQRGDEPLDLFYQFRGRYREAAGAFEEAVQSLDQQAPDVEIKRTLVSLLAILGWYHIRLGRLAEAQAAAERCQALYQELDTPPLPKYVSDPLLITAMVALIQGAYPAAAEQAEQARQRCEAYSNPGNHQTACYILARTALLQGQYETAQDYIQQAYTTVQTAGDRWFEAYCLIEMGNIAVALQNYSAAQDYFQAAYALRQEFNDPEGMAVALNHLGQVALRQEAYATAQQHFAQSQAIYREIGDQGGLAAALNGLGQAAIGFVDEKAARLHLQQALEIVLERDFTSLMLDILAGVADLLDQTGPTDLRLALLDLIIHHPATKPDVRARARQNLSPDTRPPSIELTPLLVQVQSFLATPLSRAAPETAIAAEPPTDQSGLIEPLTERELEVLQRMAAGLTNPEIAERLIIATGTVKYYTGQIYGKLGVRNRVEAVARGRELKLIAPS